MGRKNLGRILFARRVHPDWVPELVALIESKRSMEKNMPAMRKLVKAVQAMEAKQPLFGGMFKK